MAKATVTIGSQRVEVPIFVKLGGKEQTIGSLEIEIEVAQETVKSEPAESEPETPRRAVADNPQA